MNARTLLIGIGIVAVVTGGVLGSGALTTVEADRTATVSTSGDASAAISLQLADGASDVVEEGSPGDDLDLAFTNINKNATTTVSAINVTNNIGDTVNITAEIEPGNNWLTGATVETSELGNGTSTDIVLEVTTDGSADADYSEATINITATTE